jgi:hypothetical protein
VSPEGACPLDPSTPCSTCGTAWRSMGRHSATEDVSAAQHHTAWHSMAQQLTMSPLLLLQPQAKPSQNTTLGAVSCRCHCKPCRSHDFTADHIAAAVMLRSNPANPTLDAPNPGCTKPWMPQTLQPKPWMLQTLQPKPWMPQTLQPKPWMPQTLQPKPWMPQTLQPKPWMPQTLQPKPWMPPKKTKPWMPQTLQPKPWMPQTRNSTASPDHVAAAVTRHVCPCAVADHRHPALWCNLGGAPVLEHIAAGVNHSFELQQGCSDAHSKVGRGADTGERVRRSTAHVFSGGGSGRNTRVFNSNRVLAQTHACAHCQQLRRKCCTSLSKCCIIKATNKTRAYAGQRYLPCSCC